MKSDTKLLRKSAWRIIRKGWWNGKDQRDISDDPPKCVLEAIGMTILKDRAPLRGSYFKDPAYVSAMGRLFKYTGWSDLAKWNDSRSRKSQVIWALLRA